MADEHMWEITVAQRSKLGTGLASLKKWLASMTYQLEWEREGELVLNWPLCRRKTAISPEHVDYVLARLFCP